MEMKCTTLTIKVTTEDYRTWCLAGKALGVTTEEAMAQYLKTLWLRCGNIDLILDHVFDTREEAEQLQDRVNQFFHDAQRNKNIPLPVAYIRQLGENVSEFAVFIEHAWLSSVPTLRTAYPLLLSEYMKKPARMRYGTENMTFEKDVHFMDKKNRKRCFYVRATVPIFVHEEEDFVQAVGEPEFQLILRDALPSTEHDLEDFVSKVKDLAVKERRKTFTKRSRG
jgi:hypothetical protein